MKRKFTPFSISPNPVALFLTDALEAALFKIRYCVEYRQGFTAVLGDVGVGKSSLIRYAHAEFDAMEDVVSILIPTPNFKTEYAFIQTITGAVGLPPRKSVQQHEREFEAWLAEQYLADKAVILFIDEAQKLSTKMLELVRSFLNFETNEAKLLQIILAGQLELRDRLRTKKMKPLYSRLINPTVLQRLYRLSRGWKSDECEVGLGTLAKFCVMSRSQVQRSVAALTEKGLIVNLGTSKKGSKDGNRYRVLPGVPTAPPQTIVRQTIVQDE